MGYEAAFKKSWDELANLCNDNKIAVNFLADEYTVDLKSRSILSLSCNIPAKDTTAILILHYLIQRIRRMPFVAGEWISYGDLRGFESYEPVFKKRAVAPIVRKYGKNPEGLIEAGSRFGAAKGNIGDACIILDAFAGVPVMVTLWKGDEEFGANAGILFDKSVVDVFCTEDIVVLAETIAHAL